MHETRLKEVMAYNAQGELVHVEVIEAFFDKGSTVYTCTEKETGNLIFVRPAAIRKIIVLKDDPRDKVAEQSSQMLEAVKNMFGGIGEVAETDIPFE